MLTQTLCQVLSVSSQTEYKARFMCLNVHVSVKKKLYSTFYAPLKNVAYTTDKSIFAFTKTLNEETSKDFSRMLPTPVQMVLALKKKKLIHNHVKLR